MYTIIMPIIPRQADVYAEEEWTWRGIVDPTLFGGATGIGGVVVPRVLHSTINIGVPTTLTVKWDRPMEAVCDIKAHLRITINGAHANPLEIIFNPADESMMTLESATAFVAGDIVTWNYDDTGPCDLQEKRHSKVEADTTVHSVDNKLV